MNTDGMNHVLFGASGETFIHPAVLIALLAAILLIFVLQRKYVLVPLLIVSILCPMGQTVMLGTFHFQVYRILVIFAWMRLLWQRYGTQGASYKITINAIDKAIILYTLSCVTCYTLLWQQGAAFFAEVGKAYNILSFYFVLRFFIRDWTDVERVIKVLAVIALLVSALMINEQITGRNVLAELGGVREYTAIREGYLRSQGPFTVYLTAGAFGATLAPLFLILWRKGGSCFFAALGTAAAMLIAITSRTSTALVACLATVVGLAVWHLRKQMRLIRWGSVCGLLLLHLAMKGPVWALIAKIDIVGGSTGWHRFKIIDNFIHHFWDWCFVGSNNYWTWGGGDDMWDMANQYVNIGETTGLVSLICFVVSIVYAFKYLGRARRSARGSYREWSLWLLGVALFSNLVAFFGISYYDQTFIYWYAVLALIVTVAAPHYASQASSKNTRTIRCQVDLPSPMAS